MAMAKAKPGRVLYKSSNPSPHFGYLEYYLNHKASVAKVVLSLNAKNRLFSVSPALC